MRLRPDNHYRPKAIALLAIAIALGMLTISTIPPATQTAEAAEWTPDAPPIPFLIAGDVIVDWLNSLTQGQADDAATTNLEEWGSEARAYYLADLAADWQTSINRENAHATGDIESMPTYQYVQCANGAADELFLAQKAAGESYSYDQKYVMAESGVNDLLTIWLSNEQEFYGSIYYPYHSITDRWTGYLEGCRIGMYDRHTDSDAHIIGDAGEGLDLNCGLVTWGSSTTIWLNSASRITGTKIYDHATPTIAPYGGDAIDISDYADYSADTWDIHAEDIGISSGGWYNVTGVWIGSFVPDPSQLSSVEVGMTTLNRTAPGDNWHTYWVALDDPAAYNKMYAADYSTVCNADDIPMMLFGYGALPSCYDSQYTDLKFRPIIDKWGEIGDAVEDAIDMTAAYSQSKFNQDVSQGDVVPINPVVWTPDWNNHNATIEELMGMYYAYLTFVQEWFQNHAILLPDNYTFSPASAQLLCRGAIWNATGSQVVNSSAIWSPWVNYEDMTLTVGENNTVTQMMTIMVWGYASNISAYVNATPTTFMYVPASPGFNLTINEIWYNGTSVDNITLTTIHYSDLDPTNPDTHTPAPEPPTLTDMEWILAHWFYFGGIFGGMVTIIGVLARNPTILAIGTIVMAISAIGWIWDSSGGLGGIIDLLMSSVDPLTEWVRGLR